MRGESGGAGALVLRALAPFDLSLTVAVTRRRPTNLVDTFAAGEYRRLVMLGNRPRLIAVRQVDESILEVAPLDGALDSAEQSELAALLDRTLGLTRDMTPIVSAFGEFEPLARLVSRLRGMKPPRYPNLWTTIVGIVPYQQVSLEAGQAISNRMIADIGTRIEYDGVTYFNYPSAEQFLRASDDQTRAWGLSIAKVRTLRGAAEAIASGALTEDELIPLDDEAAITRLTQLHGIGQWSAQVILLRGLGRLSAFPLGDSGAQRAFKALFGWEAGEIDARRSELLAALREWRGYLYFVLLGASLLDRGQIEPSLRPEA